MDLSRRSGKHPPIFKHTLEIIFGSSESWTSVGSIVNRFSPRMTLVVYSWPRLETLGRSPLISYSTLVLTLGYVPLLGGFIFQKDSFWASLYIYIKPKLLKLLHFSTSAFIYLFILFFKFQFFFSVVIYATKSLQPIRLYAFLKPKP